MEELDYYDLCTTLDVQLHLWNGYTMERIATKFRKPQARLEKELSNFYDDFCANCVLDETLSELFARPNFSKRIFDGYLYVQQTHLNDREFRYLARYTSPSELCDRIFKTIRLERGDDAFTAAPFKAVIIDEGEFDDLIEIMGADAPRTAARAKDEDEDTTEDEDN